MLDQRDKATEAGPIEVERLGKDVLLVHDLIDVHPLNWGLSFQSNDVLCHNVLYDSLDHLLCENTPGGGGWRMQLHLDFRCDLDLLKIALQ